MLFTDTHVHIYSAEFDADRSAMLERAMSVGVQRFFLPAIDASYTFAMHQLAAQYPGKVFLMAGLHPVYVSDNFEQELQHVAAELKTGRYCAVGEIGIDLYWNKETLPWQQVAFKYQLELAKQHNMPVNIHCREAFAEIFEILEQQKGPDLRGIFHCFTGSYEQALQAIDCGMKLGIGGVVTFKNGKIDQFLKQIDLRNIVLETDAPYLAPAPYRGRRNECSYLLHVAQKLADIYGISIEEVAAITTQNAVDVYRI